MAALRTCPKCRALLEPRTRECPYCGTDVRHLDAPSVSGDAAATSQFGVWLLTLNVAMYLLMVFLDPTGGPKEGTLDPSSEALMTYGACNSDLIQGCGQYWRLFAAIFLHAGIVHLLMNSIAVFVLLPIAAVTFGAHRTIVLYLVTGVASFYVSQLQGGSSVGASGALCGLIGALLVWGHRRGGVEGRAIKRRMAVWALYVFLIGQFMAGIDNWAHGGGFVAGLALGWIAARVRMRGGREDRIWRGAALASVVLGIAVAGLFLAPNVVRSFERRDVMVHRNELKRTLDNIGSILLAGEPSQAGLPERVPEGPGESESVRASLTRLLELARQFPRSPETTAAFLTAKKELESWTLGLRCEYGIYLTR